MVMKWPTWQMNSERFVYRCPCANKRDWLFGRSNGNNVGWIKHRNCTGCPESCSQDWMYWDDNVNQWYYDKKIRISTDASRTTCSSKTSDILILVTSLLVFCAFFSICVFLACKGCVQEVWRIGNGGTNQEYSIYNLENMKIIILS